MLLQYVREDLQGKALLLTGLLAPLVRVHFSVRQVSVVVLVICRQTGQTDGEECETSRLLLSTRQTADVC